uniref:USP domain-containing protein n=1 Tax=Salarias fasciatus TaxID=181472 RepID=A0A672IUC8_SALFA
MCLTFTYRLLAPSSQASNFLRAFRTIPEASALGLILADSDEQTGKARLGRLIQSWNRFILTQLHQETQEQEGPQAYRGASSRWERRLRLPQSSELKSGADVCGFCVRCSSLGSSGESAIGKLFGCEVENSSLCRCGKETVRSSLTLLFTMHYPEQNSQGESDVLLKLLTLYVCDQLSASEEAEGAALYDLVVTVPHILDARTGGNLVAHIKVGETYHQRKEGVTHQQWYLFNDFLIEPIDKTEAAQFDVSWKVPAILYYAKRNYHSKYDLRIKNPIDASVLLTEASLARKQRKSHATFIPLMVSEMPQAGDLVGLDAEFVTLNQEEAELRSDGTKSTIKPSQMSVARITCVRGQGPNEGVPFIDDYISTQEQVVDYLTQYSGIKPGDLDAKISSKHLTTLKSTYLKLRFLIDTGVRFVGHGLQKDFRVINLLVLKDQVIDTVYLFHLPRKRMISLRFLAWYFLDLNIQGETHDSIEDARTALQLYRKYLELSRGGSSDEVRKVLKGLYEKGRQLDWKVPDSDAGDGQGSPKSSAVFPSVMGL